MKSDLLFFLQGQVYSCNLQANFSRKKRRSHYIHERCLCYRDCSESWGEGRVVWNRETWGWTKLPNKQSLFCLKICGEKQVWYSVRCELRMWYPHYLLLCRQHTRLALRILCLLSCLCLPVDFQAKERMLTVWGINNCLLFWSYSNEFTY